MTQIALTTVHGRTRHCNVCERRPGGRHRRQVHHYIGFNNEEFASANDVVKADITQEGDTMIFRDTDGKTNLEVSLVRGAAGNILQVSNPERESSG